jgi:hypothetical protein
VLKLVNTDGVSSTGATQMSRLLSLKPFDSKVETKTEYMRCQFSGDNSDDGDVSLDKQVVPMNDTFRYLG